jgi:hypothetical protein
VPKLHQGIKVLDRADLARRIDAPQEQHLCEKPGPNTG